MKPDINLKIKFQEYFHEQEAFGLRSERFAEDYNNRLWYEDSQKKFDVMAEWLEASFLEGARVMALDTVETLDVYSDLVAGIDETHYNKTQAFDYAKDNLMMYYTQILNK